MSEEKTVVGEQNIFIENAKKKGGFMDAEAQDLTPEQKEDLKEACEAEMAAMGAQNKFDELQKDLYALHSKMVDFAGRDPQGPLAYLRVKAQEKLEEFSHRLGDMLAVYRMKDQAEMEAMQKAAAAGTIVDLTGRK